MIKWIMNKIHKYGPECMCGYKMKPFDSGFDYSWKCIWEKRCGWEAHETFNGTMHWKKDAKNA